MGKDMNAPSKPQTEQQARHSLMQKCGNNRHELLQLYAELEMLLSNGLFSADATIAKTPADARTFGKKLQLARETDQEFEGHADLGTLRNLLAHAKIDVMTANEERYVVLRVADVDSGKNARIIAERDWAEIFNKWRDMLSAASTAAGNLKARR